MEPPAAAHSDPPPGRPGEIFAWAMYDWANSAYSTLLITIVLHYLQEVVLPGKWGPLVYAWGISVSMFIAAVLSPIVGALADANRSKRRWLAGTALCGASAAVLMASFSKDQVALIVGSFVLMNICFDLSLVPYNGFQPEITNRETINRVSAWGYALGYLGGSVPLLIAGLIVLNGEKWGLPDAASQDRVGILILGLWWGIFTLPALGILRDRGTPPESREPIHRAARGALRQVGRTMANVRVYPTLSLFLLAFLCYNDGVQSVITQATTLANKKLSFSIVELFLLVLIIQAVALPGALLIGWLSDRWGQKPVLLGCLGVWIGLLVAVPFVERKLQFWIMGFVLALVLGGTQSVSRAIMGLMTPQKHAAEFFGFFNLSGKAASFLGPALFGLIIWWTNDVGLASFSLLIFFLIGWVIVVRINVETGRQQALHA